MTNKAYTGKVDFGFVYFYIYYTYYSKNISEDRGHKLLYENSNSKLVTNMTLLLMLN